MLKAYCYFCHKRAGFSLRTVRNDKEILIGAADMYRPVCKACYYKNNLIESDNYSINIEGDLNEISESRFVEIFSSFNNIEKTDLTKLNNSVGNKITNSSSIDIVNTNNNVVAVRNIIIQDKPAFLQYGSKPNSEIKIVKNLINKVNMQSDNQGRTLIIDEQKFYQESGISGTKSDKKYEIINGNWTETKG